MPPIKSKTASIHLKNKEPVISERPNGSFNNAAEDAPRILNNCFYLPDKEGGGGRTTFLFLKIKIILIYFPKTVQERLRGEGKKAPNKSDWRI